MPARSNTNGRDKHRRNADVVVSPHVAIKDMKKGTSAEPLAAEHYYGSLNLCCPHEGKWSEVTSCSRLEACGKL